MSYGCGTYPGNYDGQPIGGGVGCTTLYTEAGADVLVHDAAGLKAALAAAGSGDIIYVEDGETIILNDTDDMYNVNNTGFYVPDGVILAGGRGNAGVTAGKIVVQAGFKDNDWCYLIKLGTGSKICGLELDGNQSTALTGYTWGGVNHGVNSELYNCVVKNFGYAGTSAGPDITGALVDYCAVSYCRGAGHGYGVEVAAVNGTITHDDDFHTAGITVYGCTFDYHRHVVANQSGKGSYTFHHNYLGSNAAYESQCDVHGQQDGEQTTLASAVLIADDHIHLAVTDFAYDQYVTIDSEVLYLSGANTGDSYPVTRAQYSTSAAAHSSGATVYDVNMLKVGGEYVYCSGGTVSITYNTSDCNIENGVEEFCWVRGAPHSTGSVTVTNNWLRVLGSSGLAMSQHMDEMPDYGYNTYEGDPDHSFVRMTSSGNWYGPPIDIGAGASNRAGTVSGGGYTDIDLNNPANADGVLTKIEIWAATDLAGCIVGTFYTSDYVTFTCRDSCALGTVTAGSKQTYTVDGSSAAISLTVKTGDYLGIYYTSGKLERDSTGYDGLYWYYGEAIDATDSASYNFLSGDALSIYASGATSGGWTGIAKIGGIMATSISKVDGCVVGNIAKICGTAV